MTYLEKLQDKVSCFDWYVCHICEVQNLDEERIGRDSLALLRRDYNLIKNFVISPHAKDVSYLNKMETYIAYAKKNTKYHLNFLDLDAEVIDYFRENASEQCEESFLQNLYTKL
ncbi:MAG: Unknown protein [uncultured Sulfurovum sp.]|uniref:Uncharacterized protein n=1 Tax=uncultured Sulfurovum sp. TaxID=269237 RepID=A0A6S6SX10_9BACT|nr:MAG: Unknown protein [uncultured Sulfurovum sp.]